MYRSGGVFRFAPQPVQLPKNPQLLPAGTAAPDSPPLRVRGVLQQGVASAWQHTVAVSFTIAEPPMDQNDPAPILSPARMLATVYTSYLVANESQRRQLSVALFPVVAQPSNPPISCIRGQQPVVQFAWAPFLPIIRKAPAVVIFIPQPPPPPSVTGRDVALCIGMGIHL